MTPTGLVPPPTDRESRDSVFAEAGGETRSVLPPYTRRRLPQRFSGPLWISFAAHLIAMLAAVAYFHFGPDPAPIRPTGLQEVQFVDLVATEAALADMQEVPETPETPETPAASEPAEPAPSGTGMGPAGPVDAPAAAAGPLPLITAEGGATEVQQGEGGEAGGVADRLRPGFSDPRLYADPEAVRLTRPRPSDAERYQEHLQARIDAMNDSIYGRRGPNTDWTVRDGSGNRWGVSEEGVHLGPLTIPRALVPVPAASGTNQDLEAERERQRQRDEIQRQEADRERREALEESRARAAERREQGGGGGP